MREKDMIVIVTPASPASALIAAPLFENELPERLTLREQAYEEIANLIISGRLAPGEKLSLRSTAEALGVSIMPVREAVARLVADKALEVTPNKAIRVPVMSVQQFRDLVNARIMIEGEAAAQAALMHSPTHLRHIQKAEAAFREEGRSAAPDLPRVVVLNKNFHFALYEGAQSPILMEIIRALWLKAGPVINLDLRGNPERISKSNAFLYHANTLEALRHRDAAAARAAIAADISSAAEFILAQGGLEEKPPAH